MKPIVLMLCVAGIALAAPFGMVAFGTASPPAPRPQLVEPPLSGDPGVVETYTARDGARLSLRRFGATMAGAEANAPVAILIHGAGLTSLYMATLGHALATKGVTAYAPDWRGSGLSGHDGDIAHVGQLEEDLEDLLAWVGRSHPGVKPILIGYSAGGGFVLRIASKKIGSRFAKLVAVAPYLGLTDPAMGPPESGHWAKAFFVRFLGLKTLNAFGIHTFDGLPVLAFAVPQTVDPARGEPAWSYRMVESFIPSGGASVLPPGRTWRDDIQGARGRLAVLFGGADVSIDPRKAEAEFAAAAPEVPVTVVPDTDHFGLVQKPAAVASIVAAAL